MVSFKTPEGGGKAYGSIVIQQKEEEAAQPDVLLQEDEPLIVLQEADDGDGAAEKFNTCTNNDDHDHDHGDDHAYPPLSEMWNNLVFSWFTPVVESMKQQVEFHQSPNLETNPDIPPLPNDDSTRPVSQQFQRAWEDELQQASREARDPQLATILWQCSWFQPLFLQAGFLKAIHDCLQFVGPQVLNGLIHFLRDPDAPLSRGVYLTLVVTAAQLCMSLTLRHYFFKCYRVGLRIRTAVLLAIYQKSLTIDTSYYQTHPIGQITNLMSVDVQRLQDVVNMLHAIWYSALQIVLALYFLWQQLGPSCLAGVLVILASIPLTGITARWMGDLQKNVMAAKDQRVQINQEILANMKVVKLQAWEGPFLKKISKFRQIELKRLLVYMLGQATTWLMWSAVPLLIALFTFGAYVAIAGQVLDVASALTALALFEILRFPLFMLPMVINMLVEAGVSLKRIQDFLSAPNHIPPKRISNTKNNNNNDDDKNKAVIQVSNATFSYQNTTPTCKPTMTKPEELGLAEQDLLLVKAKLADAEEQLAQLEGRPAYKYGSLHIPHHRQDDSGNLLALRRVTLDSYQGEFLAVVGGVGCGKSTLLKALVGEVHTVSGEVGIDGKIAYFDQKPFIMNDTVKGNILFGKPDDTPELYQLAIKSCSLEHDLSLLPHGDETEIGERGITLSGGQKARIAMARVVYHNADISLLDDCLSAVDAHVGRDLFDECILKVLLQRNIDSNGNQKKRTVILVTNALQYLSHPLVDRIVVLNKGTIVETGSYKELLARENSEFKSSLRSFNESMSGDYSNETDDPIGDGEAKPGENATEADGSGGIPARLRSLSIAESTRDADGDADKGSKKLMTDEMDEREIGKVGGDVYMEWARAAGGVWVAIPLLLIFSAGEVVAVLSNWWLTYWSHSASKDIESQMHFLSIYGLINIVAIVADFLPMAAVLLLGLRASKKVSKSRAVLNVPLCT
jgi:ABC-type multidrug transport system fused ATPase/permease subunit